LFRSESRTLLKTEENVPTITETDNEGSQEDIFIFNYVSSVQKPLTWGKFMMYSENYLSYPSSKFLWYYGLKLNKHRIIHFVYSMLLHFLPALLIDTAVLVLGKKPM
jgi:fatty acyl-CoA reductase